jgi:acyl-CoA thioester hydrolase
MKIRIYYEDTDIGGIVYHSNYLKYCERARSELFFEKGLTPHSDNQFFVVTKLEANFINSAKLGDMIEVRTKVLQTKKVSLTLYQEVLKENNIIYTQTVKLAFLKDNKPSIIPIDQINILTGTLNV